MNTNFSFTQKTFNFGFNPPQDQDRTSRRKMANDQWSETDTHFLKVGRDGNELKTGYLKQEKDGENELKKGPLGNENETSSFWTVCPYCYHMYEYESKYEDCCLLCQHCKRGFHGLAVDAPPESFLSNANVGRYHFGYGFFPLGYSGANGFFSNKKLADEGDDVDKPVVVEISDDSDIENDGMVMENNVCEVKMDCFEKGLMRRVKAVARNPKKLMGRGIKQKGMVEKMQVMEMNEEFWKEVDKNGDSISKVEDGFEFFEEDDDIFVGLRDIC